MEREIRHRVLARELWTYTDEELAELYCVYMDTATNTLINGFMEEAHKRGLSLTDLEDYCS